MMRRWESVGSRKKNEAIKYPLSRQPAPFWFLSLQAETFGFVGGGGGGKSEPKVHRDGKGTGFSTSRTHKGRCHEDIPWDVLRGPLTLFKIFPHISCPPLSRKPTLAPSRQGQLLADTQMAPASQPIYLSRKMLPPSAKDTEKDVQRRRL